jgi:hypothetical protein
MRAKLTVSALGVHGGFAGSNGGNPGRRGDVKGWSAASARGNLRFLRSIDVENLPRLGIAFTLTIGQLCGPREWHDLKRGLVRFLVRRGVLHWHCVTEWQERGHPHLHGCAMLGPDTDPMIMQAIYDHWLDATAHLGTSERAQNVKLIHGAQGWFQYTAKHASRGFAHYQRMAGALPPGWDKTGRMWSCSRQWPRLSDGFDVSRESFYHLRRHVDRFAMAQARTELANARRFCDVRAARNAKRRIRFLKLLRKSFGKGRSASETRGLNEWVSYQTVLRLVDLSMSAPSRWTMEREPDGSRVYSSKKFSVRVAVPPSELRDF